MSEYLDSDLQNSSHIVWCIEEVDDNISLGIDTRVFIFWDDYAEDYVVAGCRLSKHKETCVPYVLHFDNSDSLKQFIRVVFEDRVCNSALYNYNNLNDVEEYTFEFFNDNLDSSYEIIAYDNLTIDYGRFRNILKMLRDSYGYNN